MYLSITAAAAHAGYSASTIRRLIKAGKLKAYRVTPTSHPRIKRDELEKLLASGGEDQLAPTVDLDDLWERYGLNKRTGQQLH